MKYYKCLEYNAEKNEYPCGSFDGECESCPLDCAELSYEDDEETGGQSE